jgi:hypothetical protein
MLCTLLYRFRSITYSSGAQYAAELIPTEVRGQVMASIHMVGFAATFFSAHILYLVSRITDAAARVPECLTDRTGCCAVSQAPRPVVLKCDELTGDPQWVLFFNERNNVS